MMFPYHKSCQIVICPSVSVFTVTSGVSTNAPRRGHYGANRAIMPTVTDGDATVALRLSQLESPAGTYMIFDSGTIAFSSSYVLNPAGTENYIPGTESIINKPVGGFATALHPDLVADYESGRHFGGISVGFADGHVKWLKAETVVAEARKTGKGAWNPANF